MKPSVALTRILLVCGLIAGALGWTDTAHAQILDSELVQMASKGSFSLSGVDVIWKYEHEEQNGPGVEFDSTLYDTVLISRSQSWSPPWVSPASLKDSILKMFTPTPYWQTTNSQVGFDCKIDTTDHLLISVHCLYHDERYNSVSGTITHIELIIDSVPYTLSNTGLTASLRGERLVKLLRSISISDEDNYNGSGITGYVDNFYGPIVDTLGNPTFTLVLNGPFTSSVRSNREVIGRADLFPNPCKDVLNVSLPTGTQSSVRIYDLLGRMCSETQVPSGATSTLRIDTRNLPNGRYILATQNSSVAFSVLR
jgi:hypothetical protein